MNSALATGKYVPDTAVNFTVTTSGANEVVNVKWAVPGGTSGAITALNSKTGGTWNCTLPAAALVAGKLTTVTVIEMPKAGVNISIDASGFTGSGLAASVGAVVAASIANGDTISGVKAGQSIVITANEGFTFTVAASAFANCDPTITPDTATSEVTVTDVYVTGTLTIADPIP